MPKEPPKVNTTWIDARREILNSLPNGDTVFLGTSLTEGFPVAELYGYKNRGIGGSTSADILKMGQFKNNVVYLETGINDIIQEVKVDSFMTNLDSIVKRCGKVYIHSVLPTGKEYSRLNPEVDRYNKAIKEYCQRSGIAYIDTHSHFDDSFSFDGVHLNLKGYKMWQDVLKAYRN